MTDKLSPTGLLPRPLCPVCGGKTYGASQDGGIPCSIECLSKARTSPAPTGGVERVADILLARSLHCSPELARQTAKAILEALTASGNSADFSDLPRLIELQRTAAPEDAREDGWNAGLERAAEMVREASGNSGPVSDDLRALVQSAYVEGHNRGRCEPPVYQHSSEDWAESQTKKRLEAEIAALRLRMFLEILLAAGGTADASDWPGSWTNAFCEEHEKRDPDTFNRAIDAGYVSWSHNSDTDNSTITLTDKGRNLLNEGERS